MIDYSILLDFWHIYCSIVSGKLVGKGSILHSLIYPFSTYLLCSKLFFTCLFVDLGSHLYSPCIHIGNWIFCDYFDFILLQIIRKRKRKKSRWVFKIGSNLYFVTEFCLSLHSFAALTTLLYINKTTSSFINKAAFEIIWWRGGQLLEFSLNPHWIQNQVLLVCLFLAQEALLLLAIFWSKLAHLWLQCSWLQRIWVSSVNLPFQWCRGRNWSPLNSL